MLVHTNEDIDKVKFASDRIEKEKVNEIMEYVKRKTAAFSYMDQAQIYGELESRLADLNADALRNEYLGSNIDDYILDGV